MPSRKQRRRRAKEQRHEYELVVVDDEGREIEVDREELRKKREQEKAAAAARSSRNGRGRAGASRDARGRRIREAKPPSWRRSIQRAVLFAALLFVLTTFLQRNSNIAVQVAISVGYGLLGIPFFYFLDRQAYHRWLRATGREDEIKRRR